MGRSEDCDDEDDDDDDDDDDNDDAHHEEVVVVVSLYYTSIMLFLRGINAAGQITARSAEVSLVPEC